MENQEEFTTAKGYREKHPKYEAAEEAEAARAARREGDREWRERAGTARGVAKRIAAAVGGGLLGAGGLAAAQGRVMEGGILGAMGAVAAAAGLVL